MVPDDSFGLKERIDFARYWYQKGVCPGCESPLELVAGVGQHHIRPGEPIYIHQRITITNPGHITRLTPMDPRVCRWDSDQLAALVHIGSGLACAKQP